LKGLPPEERTLLFRRYFKRHTQAQIARDMGTSQVQISRMESRILKKLRQMAGG
jgi:RNA polymerase sporulation-specific sigma factor